MARYISTAQYRALAEFRYQLRGFLHQSENAAHGAGLEAQQHQLLLALKGLPQDREATISELAERLQLRHHSVVGLVDRLEAHGLVQRTHRSADRRVVVVRLRPLGDKVLRELSMHHRDLLRNTAPALVRALRDVIRHTSPGRIHA